VNKECQEKLRRGGPEEAGALDDGGFVAAEFADKGLVAGFFVVGSPEDHFGEDGREFDAFAGERIGELAAVGGVARGFDDAGLLEFAEAIGEDVGGNFFVGVEELLESVEAADHDVADDEERPAVAKHFDGRVERAVRTARRVGGRPLFGGHEFTIAYFNLHFASWVEKLRLR